jgi:hypothetical protein
MISFQGHYINKSHTSNEKVSYANTLKALRAHTGKLVVYLQGEFPSDARTHKLSKWYQKEHKAFHEIEHYENRTFGYNIGKGKYIAVCLHDARNRPNSFNETFFVVLHELAHIATEEYAHNLLFWDTYRWLIHAASHAGLYENIDYGKDPRRHCNYQLNHNPFFDNNNVKLK